jgi:hypothetical protein
MGAGGTQTVDTTMRLVALRELMNQGENSVKAYIVPSEDQRECVLQDRNHLPISRENNLKCVD